MEMSRQSVIRGIRAIGCAAVLAGSAATAAAQGQTAGFDRVGTIPGPFELIRAEGSRAYLVHGRTLSTYDLSNPAAPKKGGSYTFPDKIWGFRLVGSLVYAAVDKYGLGVLDVSNPDDLVLKGTFKTPGQAKSVALVGTTALVADHMAGVNFIDVSNPAKPVSRGSFFLDGYARAVAASGTVAAAVDAPTGLYVFDFSKPDRLEPVSTEQSAERPGSVELMTAGTGSVVAVLAGGGSLQLYDISDPAAPVKITAFRTASGRPQRVALDQATAYVADGQEGLQVVDLTTPASPRVAGAFKTPLPARDVAVAGSLVLVVSAQGGEAPTEGSVLILRRTS